jgi:hypothetical protein
LALFSNEAVMNEFPFETKFENERAVDLGGVPISFCLMAALY